MNDSSRPDAEPFSTLDPFGVSDLFARVQRAWLSNPAALAGESLRLAGELQQLNTWMAGRWLGMFSPDPVKPRPEDERFADPAWRDLPAFDALKEYYLLLSRWLNDVVYATPGLSETEKADAAFWLRQWLNAQAPSNYFLTNPVALRRCLESGGMTALAGVQHFLRDSAAGDIQMVDPEAFEVGQNLALTPGSVVMRNRLVEVIHYQPATPRVHTQPVVIITPWINKYYVLDLRPRKSLVRWLVAQGFDVYITSWKNPGVDMADTGFGDYVFEGALATVDAAREISGAEQVHLVGYCLGGTAVAALMAWLAAERPEPADSPVADWTLFAALVDFRLPGDIEVFLGERGIEAVERLMEAQGYLDGRDMARTFRMLRPNSLIWHYYVNSYLYGEELPAFDVLYWNTDTTRMPRAMHSWYLRELYQHNRLAQPGGVTLRGHPLDVGAIRQPLYAVGTEEDHIAPWEAGFRATELTGGPARYVLSTSGHIVGIVNPPVDPPKRRFRAAEVHAGEDAAAWRARVEQQPDSWWTDWAGWLRRADLPEREPPPVGSAAHPVIEPAPGSYVFGK